MRILEPSRKRKNSHQAGEEHGRHFRAGENRESRLPVFLPWTGRDTCSISPLPSIGFPTDGPRSSRVFRPIFNSTTLPLHTPAIVHCSPLARRPKERTHHYDSRRRRRQRRRSPSSSSPETDEQPFSAEVDEGVNRGRARARASNRRGGFESQAPNREHSRRLGVLSVPRVELSRRRHFGT